MSAKDTKSGDMERDGYVVLFVGQSERTGPQIDWHHFNGAYHSAEEAIEHVPPDYGYTVIRWADGSVVESGFKPPEKKPA